MNQHLLEEHEKRFAEEMRENALRYELECGLSYKILELVDKARKRLEDDSSPFDLNSRMSGYQEALFDVIKIVREVIGKGV